MQTALPSRFLIINVHQLPLPALFALFGLLMGSWAGRIPALRDGLAISHSTLSLVLLCGGLGAVLSHPVATHMMAKHGGRTTVFCSGLALCLVLPAIGLAASPARLMLAVLMLGLAAGCLGVGINSVATAHEKKSGKSGMSMLHAWGCGGSLAGALIGSLVAGMGVRPSAHFIAVSIPVALLLCWSCRMLGGDGKAGNAEKKRFALPSGPLALLGMLGFCSAMSENSIADWSGVFLKDHYGVKEGFAPLALSAFTVMMMLSRLAGDRLKERHGARRLVSTGAVVAAGGLFLAVFAPNPYLALVGFAFAGLGLALVFPFVFSAAGREGPMAVAAVATMSNVGGLMGPPVIGTMADHLGMQTAIGFIGLLSVAIAVIAARAGMLK